MINQSASRSALLDALGIGNGFAAEYAARHDGVRTLVGGCTSSYVENGYDAVFYSIMRAWQPRLYLEFGVLSGYSLLAAAAGLKENGIGTAVGVDLFEDYAYNKDYEAAVQQRIDSVGLTDVCTLRRQSVFDISPDELRPDVMHIDISNNGETVEALFHKWSGSVGMAMLFEGGGPARDQVEWMIRYEKAPLHPVFEKLSELPGWSVLQSEPFPSFTAVVRTGLLKAAP